MNDFDQQQNERDLFAETAVLGSMMISPDAVDRALEAVSSRDFKRPGHQLVFEAISALANRGMGIDPLTVADELDKHQLLAKAGGALKLHEMTSAVPTAVNVGYYLGQVREAAVTRHTLMAAMRVGQVMGNREVDLDDRVDAVRSLIDDATRLTSSAPLRSVADVIGPLLDRLGSKAPAAGVTTGWADLDDKLTKLRPGQLIVVGARPGMGKSVIMANLAAHVRIDLGLPVLYASLEMSEDEITLRMVAQKARADLARLQRGDLGDDEWSRVADWAGRIAEYNDLIIDDDASMTIAKLRSSIRRMRRNNMPPALVVVDYLQLMSTGKRTESRQAEVSELSRNLKILAKEFEVPVVVGSQLNRESEKRATKRPTQADLRESGAVEQDADVILLLHREDAYEPESPRAGEIDVIVEKNRQGPRGVVTLAWQGHYARAMGFERDHRDGRPNLHAVN
ncbi:replicative DNA helicase [Streptosporangium sp. NPDC000239]|uniref:replicative DNA helicase n=1 Tax=Streptosporangium sp. NPDC000239 TaxID=3154248 RepID=UPI00332DD71F